MGMMQDHCLRLEKMTDQEVGMEAIYALRKVYGSSIPWPTALLRSDWNRDPNYVPEVSALEQDIIEVDADTKELLKLMDFDKLATPGDTTCSIWKLWSTKENL